ncbi:ribosomal protein S18-alanine N-acetyltransferase [Enterococcus sp. BWB1-3]|nr:ribosomal protein S18-alanine N-acetyltransferase [Enterococcus sp. BWB1-3]MBL1230483.1 ribosomal protein S18-alanine N-acetyltransferase [Enterococcus sp. BWB1-3]MCB5955304.1 ribosomal protein S18-alanine N-acetyltransferase [Enterococcus sp. CWB-B31]
MSELKELPSVSQSEEKLWLLSENSYFHGSPWTKDQFKEDISQPNSHYLIYTANEVWLGFVSYYQTFDEADITHVVVEKSRQSSGVGKRMLKSVIQCMKESGVKTVFLEVRESNEPAKKLYKSLGFRQIGKRKNYYHQPTEDGMVMEMRMEELN